MELSKDKYKDIILSIDEENAKCVDCGKENPMKVSVNNGIILCEGCALQHLELGSNISYIRDLAGDFDEYLLNYFTLGGNSKFIKFLKEENVDTSLPINKKYLTKACEFYRINLKKKVQGENLIKKNYENPNEIVENIDEYLLMYRLSQNKNTNKIVNQRISYYCIQKEYKANKLSNCNITANIQNEIKKGSINNVAKSIEKGNLSFEYLKRKKYLKFAWTFLISSICSKYQLIQNINNIKYFFIKNR